MHRPDVWAMLQELDPRTVMYWRAYYKVLGEEDAQRAQQK